MAGDRAWLEVDVAALRRNGRRLSDRLGPVRTLPMVKADGYGLGAVRVARALADLEPWAFGVATAEEGRTLREAGIGARVVVFADWAARVAGPLLEARLEPVLTGPASLSAWRAAAGRGGPVPGHLEVDTGMSRTGFRAEETERWVPRVAAAVREGWLRLESTFTHFHSAARDRAETQRQWERFTASLAALESAGLDPGVRHAANSAAIFRHPEVRADVVRPGLFLYGGRGPGEGFEPPGEPVVRLRARVLEVRNVPVGTTVGYGATWRAGRPSRVATLGVGYGDGLPHALSNRGVAIAGGRRVPIVGGVCMDTTMVDVTDAGDVEPGSVATLLGPDGEEEITLKELASASGTIEYEVLTGFGQRLPRRETGATDVGTGDVEGRRRAAG